MDNNKKILIIDDEPINLKLLQKFLEKDYLLSFATDGYKAIDIVKKVKPDLIILDILMPKMNGYEVCRRFKQDEETAKVPVIFISALKESGEKVKGFEAGGVDFISKPFQVSEVLARIKTHLKLCNMQYHLEELVVERTSELASSEARFRAIFENLPIAMALLDLKGNVLVNNSTFEHMIGYTKNDFNDISFTEITHPKDIENDIDFYEEMIEGNIDSYEIEKRYFHKQGHIVWAQINYAVVRDNSHKEIEFIIWMAQDITLRKHTEQQILDYQQRLKSLTSQLTLTEEKERRKLASDLHDHVGHSLALARMQLKGIFESKTETERDVLVKDISSTLLKAMQETRNLIFELSSPIISEYGLSAAIGEWLEEQIEKKYKLKSDFIDHTSKSQKKSLDDNVRDLMYRNVIELLTNVVKHANADKVSVCLSEEGSYLKIIVEDDGVGFDIDEEGHTEKMNKHSFGLFSIQERMSNLGGSFLIQSKPGKGCKVILTAPINLNK